MTITLESIEMLRARADVTYEEAKEALEKCNGELVDALIYLEKQEKIKATAVNGNSQSSLWAKLKRLVKKCHAIRLLIIRADDKLIDMPLTIVIIAAIFATPLLILGVLVALFTGYKIRVNKPDGQDSKINKTLDDISSAAVKVSDQMADAINKI